MKVQLCTCRGAYTFIEEQLAKYLDSDRIKCLAFALAQPHVSMVRLIMCIKWID